MVIMLRICNLKQNKEQINNSLNFQKKKEIEKIFLKRSHLKRITEKIFNKTTIKEFEITIIFYNIFRNNIKERS